MEQDIFKIAEYLERVTEEGLALEEKIVEWHRARATAGLEEQPKPQTN